MTATATTWSEKADEVHRSDVESMPNVAWAFDPLLRDDSEHLDHLSDLVGSSIESFVSVSPKSFDAQTDVNTPQLERKLRALQCSRYLLARSSTSKWSTEEPDWHRFSSSERFFEEYQRGLMGVWESRRAYQTRIRDLIRYGIDEGISMNEASLVDFWAFVRSAGYTRRAGLALMDNGNLRAVWKGR